MEIPKKYLEIERKYLLSSLPPKAEDSKDVLEIKQYYIPGEMIKERVTEYCVYGGDTPTYMRTVKVATGPSQLMRFEFDEEINEDEFYSLMRTAKSSIDKSRFKVDDWAVDAFYDVPGLFIAEIELNDKDDNVPIPEWLSTYVLREVTEEESYKSETLAIKILDDEDLEEDTE